ncbi:MAG: hypothetical protein Q8K59_05235 [Nitrosomonas sp.]|nr:hypothetical protein [Nitrosomonas sp.]MDP1950488.1 hypothetical protein [Nitrosomonas sp.]
MDSELKSLEEKVNRLLSLYQNVRLENIKLRQQLSESNTMNEALTGKIQIAANRLETLLTNIPENIK